MDINILNNTGIDTASTGNFLKVENHTDSITLENNLLVATSMAVGGNNTAPGLRGGKQPQQLLLHQRECLAGTDLLRLGTRRDQLHRQQLHFERVSVRRTVECHFQRRGPTPSAPPR